MQVIYAFYLNTVYLTNIKNTINIMRILSFYVLSLLTNLSMVWAQYTVENVSGVITTNTTWTNNKQYLLNGYVYVKNDATLTIEAGTIIKGDKASKGSLIITRGAKIMADGTPDLPIVFTSNQAVGSRNYGDWGGLIICGKARTNKAGGQGEVEGGVNNANGDALYGGTDDNDNSGILRYVRIEFPGIAFSDNNEINGLTLAGVGSQTVVDHVQVSYSGDDAFEFFGGTVNAKHLVALASWDDDFDTDFGYRGNIQFAVALRHPAIADQSGSNGFESDNDGSGTNNTPRTRPIFSNVTIAGPALDNGQATLNTNYKRAAHIRRASQCSIYNAIFFGFPTALLLDGTACENAAQNDSLQIKNSTFIATDPTKILTTVSGSSFNISNWYNAANNNNVTNTSVASQLLVDPQNLDAPNALPQTTSPVWGTANFVHSDLNNGFFEAVNYRGAFGTTDWTNTWASYHPQQEAYQTNTAVPNLLTTQQIQLYPNPATTQTQLILDIPQTMTLEIKLCSIDGRVLQNVVESQTISQGKQQFAIPTADLPNGFYIVQILANQQIQHSPLLIK